ncbi:MAG TPA: hypothetical protein VK760_04195 [Candidatus Acidoferrales bacterium]|nr:hypothetical protein [Candidatus Acidoferrales bacterium]
MAPQSAAATAEQAHRTNVRVKMRIVIRAVPRRGHFAGRSLHDGRRNPFYTASTTQGIDVQVTQGSSGVLAETQTNVSSSGGNCQNNANDNSRLCTFPIPVPPGNDTFTITTYDGIPVNGGGFGSANKLGYSVFSKPITAGTANNLSIALSGIVSSLSLSVPIQQIHGTLPSLQAIGVYALDADDNVILDSPYYDAGGSPISISLALGTPIKNGGTFKLSASSFSSPPAAAVQLTYDGNTTIPANGTSGAFSTTIVAKATGGTSTIAAVNQTISLIGPALQVFSVPGKEPNGLALGPDGNIWFTDLKGNAIDSITPDGTITAHKVPTANSNPWEITLGPDGNMWFVEIGSGTNPNVGWITPGAGPVRECPKATVGASLSGTGPFGIFTGPNKNPSLYVLEAYAGAFQEITTNCGLGANHPVFNAAALKGQAPLLDEGAIAPDGTIWYTETSLSKIGAMTSNGTGLLALSVPKTPMTCGASSKIVDVDGIATDPAGNAWFTEDCSSMVGRITPAGAITTFALGGPTGGAIVYGPDGNMWIATFTDGIGHLTANGFRAYGNGSTGARPWLLAVGSDSNIWFTDQQGYVGRFVW